MSALPAALVQPRARSLDDVVDWIFDLDNTLYPAHCNLFSQVDRRIGQFIEGRLGRCKSAISMSTARRWRD
jgi:putative hydrolase of the HAD superfamily